MYFLLDQINEYGNEKFDSIEKFLGILNSRKEFKFKTAKIGFCFVLDDVFNAVISYNPKYKGKTRSQNLLDGIVEWYATKLLSKDEKHSIFEDCSADGIYTNTANFVNYLAQYLKRIKSDFIYNGIKLEDSKEAQAIVNEIVNLKMFEYALTESRKGWMPQFGLGSQLGYSNDEFEIYKIITKVTNKIITQTIQKNNEDY